MSASDHGLQAFPVRGAVQRVGEGVEAAAIVLLQHEKLGHRIAPVLGARAPVPGLSGA